MAKHNNKFGGNRRGGDGRSQSNAPAHPGQVLAQVLEDTPLPLAAKWFSMTEAELRAVLEGRAPISAETAAQAGAIFGTGAAPWLEMQAAYDAAAAVTAEKAAQKAARKADQKPAS